MCWPKLKLSTEPQAIPNRFMLLVPNDWVLLYLLNDISSKYGYIQGLKELTKESTFQILHFRNRRVLMVPPGTETIFLTKAINHFKENYRLVNVFRKLLYRWMNRRFKICNDTDLLTCEPPKNLITLRVNSEKTLYQFEATTILRDMVERLLSHSYLFPKYLMPRNPFTNCEMKLNQFYSVLMQLRKAGHSHWVLEGLASTHYDIEKFKEHFGATVRKHIILTEFKTPSADTLDLVHSFIEIQHEKNEEVFHSDLYRWALEHNLRHHRIRSWVNLCKDYYIMVYTDGSGKEYAKEILRINTASRRLCIYDSEELTTLYEDSVITTGPIIGQADQTNQTNQADPLDGPDIDITFLAYLEVDLFI
jgi:hypothetical protein